MNHKLINYIFASSILILVACASTGSGAEAGLSLSDAIEQTGEKIAGELPKGSRVAIVAFDSVNGNLSEYVMEELTGALFDRGIEVADRQNLEYVYKELDFQMSGDVSDESAKSIGKFLGADLVITGQLLNIGGVYRYRTSAIRVEEAVRASITRLNVRNDSGMRRMITTLANQEITVKAAKYMVSENTTPQTIGAFLDRGTLYASRGNYEMAIKDFTEALRIDPNMSAAYILRGRAFVASVAIGVKADNDFSGITFTSTGGNVSVEKAQVYDLAIEDFTNAIRLDPNNAIAYRERGRAVNEGKGDHDQAIADFTHAIRLNINYVAAYFSRGNAYRDKREYDMAIADYNQALKIDPKFALAYYNRGYTYSNKGDYNRAIADYTQAIRIDPNFAFAFGNRGLAYSNKGDYNRAISDFTKAILLDPNNVVNYNNRGNAYEEKGDLDKAIVEYNQVIRLDPNYAFAFNGRGLAYGKKGDLEKAIADFNQAIRLDPNFATAYTNRGFAYYNKKDYDRAIADYTQAIRIDPNFAIAYNNRGFAYYNKKDYDRAIADYEAALKIDPNYTIAKNNLELARKARGR